MNPDLGHKAVLAQLCGSPFAPRQRARLSKWLDAAEFVKSELRERLEGVGLPPVRELFAKARQHAIPVYV